LGWLDWVGLGQYFSAFSGLGWPNILHFMGIILNRPTIFQSHDILSAAVMHVKSDYLGFYCQTSAVDCAKKAMKVLTNRLHFTTLAQASVVKQGQKRYSNIHIVKSET